MSANVMSSEALIELFKQALDEKWGYIWGTAGDSWTAAKQKQKVNYMTATYGTNWKKNSEAKDDNYYKAALYGSKWIGHKVADCSGLFKWAFSKYKISIAHGSNTIFVSYCTNKGKLQLGKRTDGKELKPGTAVFVYDAKKKNPYKHIGLYIGGGKVIEASGTDAGVCVSNVRDTKWTHWGELKNVTYGEDTTPVGAGWRPTLRKGDKGEYVKEAQTFLKNLGYDLGRWGVDGDFGSATLEAVKAFQRDNGLTQDGVIGTLTWDKLQNATKKPESEKTYMVCIRHLDKTQADALINNYPGATCAEE